MGLWENYVIEPQFASLNYGDSEAFFLQFIVETEGDTHRKRSNNGAHYFTTTNHRMCQIQPFFVSQ